MTIEQHLLESNALKNNRLGDPYVRSLPVYLPPDYDPAQPYPTLYLLPAHGTSALGLLNWRPWEENLPQKLDRWISSGHVPPAIIVMPDCWTKLGGSQYLDCSMGNYETYLINEVVPFINTRYPVGKSGIVGFSSGGYGALVQAMRHPDIFQAVACHAGDMYWEYTCLPQIVHLHQGLAKYGGAAQFLQDIDTIPKNGSFWKIVMGMCYAMAHGTNPAAPLGFDLPFDETTGALREDVWQRWLAFDPVRMLDQPVYQDALRSQKTLFIDAGLYDDFQLQVGARVFSQKLTQLSIPHLHEEFPGGHTSSDIRYDRSIGLLAEALR